jgi:hypothetical protein
MLPRIGERRLTVADRVFYAAVFLALAFCLCLEGGR